MTHPRYQTPAWRKIRLQALERDGYLCQIQLPGCTTKATDGCHIIRPEDGGGMLDLDNIRAGCKQCNNAERNTQLAQRAKRADYTPSRDW